MNYMKQVAEILGVELGEEFKCKRFGHSYKLTEEGLFAMSCEFGTKGKWVRNAFLHEFLTGKREIIKLPKFPEDESHYYFITNFGQVCSAVFDKDDMAHIYRFKTGNYFLTREEITEEDKKRIVEMLNSPESLV